LHQQLCADTSVDTVVIAHETISVVSICIIKPANAPPTSCCIYGRVRSGTRECAS
jgi:hypothetical protein